MARGKIEGKLISKVKELKGLKIYADYTKPKKKGKERLWITIQDENKLNKWRVYTTLNYVHGVHIAFLREVN